MSLKLYALAVSSVGEMGICAGNILDVFEIPLYCKARRLVRISDNLSILCLCVVGLSLHAVC